MQFQKIDISFNGKTFSTTTPEKIIPMIGENGMGKTSTLKGLLWGLSGGKVDGEASVAIHLDPSFRIERERVAGKTTCKLNGNKVTEKALNAAIEDKIGIALDNVRLSSSEAVLESTKPEELLKALIGFVKEKLTVEKVITHLTSSDPQVIAKVREVFPKAPMTFGLDELEDIYQNLVSERKVKNAKLKTNKEYGRALQAKCKKPARTLEAIEAELLDVQMAEKNASEAQKKLREWEKADAQKKAVDAEMVSLAEEIKKLKFKGHTVAEQKLQTDQRDKAEAKKLKLASQRSTVESNIAIFKRTLESLDKPVCPISNKLVCTTDKSAIKGELEKSVADNKKLIEDIDKQIAACNETIKGYKVWKEDFDRDFANWQKQMQLVERLKTLKEHPVAVPEKPKTIDASTVSSKKALLIAEKQNCEQYAEMMKLSEEVKKEAEEVDALNYLVNALKDKGEVKEAIIKGYLTIFQNVINDRAASFAPGYEVSLTVDGGLKIALKTPYNPKPYDNAQLSSGERLLVRFLLLDMLNQLTGTGLMFVDNVESLDDKALKHLAELISKPEFQDTYDHIFIAGVNHKEVVDLFAASK